MRTDTPQLHSTVQVEVLNETRINSNKLPHDTFSFLHYLKMLSSLNSDLQLRENC